MNPLWIVFFDLDGTLWDHLDITSTNPPFERISGSVIEDSKGIRITLLPGSVDFIKWVRLKGGIISTCSWNEYDKAFSALEAFGLDKSFDFYEISTSPNKEALMADVIGRLKLEGKIVHSDRLFYIDDRNIHIKDVRKMYPELTFFQIWKDGLDFNAIRKEISDRIEEKRDTSKQNL